MRRRRRTHLRRVPLVRRSLFSGPNEAYTYSPFFFRPCASPYDEFDHVNDAGISSSLSSPFVDPRPSLVTRRLAQDVDDRYSQLERSTSGRQTERAERGNSVKREWCAVGRQRRRTIRHGPLRCTRGRYRARDGIAVYGASGRCSYHLVAEPYHPLGRHPSTLARSSATHPAGVITPLTRRPLRLPLSRCFSP